jgi:hypothetical protein
MTTELMDRLEAALEKTDLDQVMRSLPTCWRNDGIGSCSARSTSSAKASSSSADARSG